MKNIDRLKVHIVDSDRATVAECEGALGADIDVLVADTAEAAIEMLQDNPLVAAVVTVDNDNDLKAIRRAGFTLAHIEGLPGIHAWREMLEEARMLSY